MKSNIKYRMNRSINRNMNRNINKLSLHKSKYLKGFLRQSIIAFTIVIAIVFLKKINLKASNALLETVNRSISSEFNFTEKSRNLYARTKALIGEPNKILKVFKPISLTQYPAPIKGQIFREYKKDINEGVDLKSLDGEDPKAIIDGLVKDVELVESKGYFISVEKENLLIKYGYISKPYVSKGDKIEKGSALGTLGTNKDGNKYLRLELLVDGKSTNPADYISIK